MNFRILSAKFPHRPISALPEQRMFSAEDHQFMKLALELASRGLYSSAPNPRVGCVLVKAGKIIGEGFHYRAGEHHAEINALIAAGNESHGATAYVTLEPCCHYGRTPPCTEALIKAGVFRVVAAMCDPNPEVAGKGLKQLNQAGIQTQSGLMQTEAEALNIGFISRMTRQRPWVRSKLAASLDGKTALNNGQSQWITSAAARSDSHAWRARACAVMTGIGTILFDNPQLNVRGIETSRQPLKVIVDSRLQISEAANILQSGQILIATATPDKGKILTLEKKGIEVILLRGQNNQVDLNQLILELGKRQINELHVEAGRRLNGALLEAGLIDEFLFYLAPCLLGDQAQGMFKINELVSLQDKTRLEIRAVDLFPPDLRILALARIATPE